MPAFATGTAHGFGIMLMASRVVDEDATRAAGELVLREGSFVHLLADLGDDSGGSRGAGVARSRRCGHIVHVD
ncbi:hypothetical protein [Cellulomonas sp. C5510]|uniref:hypothetical protein n=1 Tax=Cellulomonas sp. C5510 TaxID=2871170 RepID=UPI001C989650|nr:hypothetical protein [Cellulomonas sp. C5510]QZN85318.1 hypothetical protein K5O09_16355 [Cellulomonas sp. C5510]